MRTHELISILCEYEDNKLRFYLEIMNSDGEITFTYITKLSLENDALIWELMGKYDIGHPIYKICMQSRDLMIVEEELSHIYIHILPPIQRQKAAEIATEIKKQITNRLELTDNNKLQITYQ